MTAPALLDNLEFDFGLHSPMRMSDDDVARLTRPRREKRVEDLIAESNDIFNSTIEQFTVNDNRTLAGVVVLFSGGNDSTTLAHLFRDRATHAGHANTTIGLEPTRQFVRDTCAAWGLPLMEREPPRLQDHYRSLVLDKGWSKERVDKRTGRVTPPQPLGGFPGPALHWKAWTRLKERALEQIQRELVSNGRRERVAFVAGRRRTESARRSNIPENGRKGSVIWVSPLVNWTKLDLNTYRLMCGDVPRNPVSDLLHLSGECLCGSFSSPGERDQLEAFYGDEAAMVQIREMEAILHTPEYDHIPVWRKTWGWGGIPHLFAMARAAGEDVTAKADGLCVGQCIDRYDGLLAFDFGEHGELA